MAAPSIEEESSFQPKAFQVTPETLINLEKNLLDQSLSIPERFRTIFTLKSLMSNAAVEILTKALTESEPSDLLKHEVAYCLGQMGLPSAVPTLEKVLSNPKEHDMVRHEAGEALGAIGLPESLPVLKKFENDSIDAVRETCVIAIDRINWLLKQRDPSKKEENYDSDLYLSVDPAPPCKPASAEELEKIYLDSSKSLFERYRALFALREMGTTRSVEAMVKGLNDPSALFRHEVAYVLGQVQHSAAVPGLVEVLQRENEHEMVRHEAAEALGSIASENGIEVLKQYLNTQSQIVKQSVYVALDIADYTNSNEFQYANNLNQTNDQPVPEIQPFKSLQEKKQ